MFKAIYSDGITIHLINDSNIDDVRAMFSGFEDSKAMLDEINENYLPEYERDIRVKYGFYATLEGQLAGLSLLGISDIKERKGYTGADTLMHMRGRGVAPRSKPHLFFLGFQILGLNRIETGCRVTNIASKRSIEKTAGFQFEGTMRKSGLNEHGEFEDEYLYAILRDDWVKLYDPAKIEIIG